MFLETSGTRMELICCTHSGHQHRTARPVPYAFSSQRHSSRIVTKRLGLSEFSMLQFNWRRQGQRKWAVHSVGMPAESELYTTTENELVLVAGASGGVGQLVTAKLLERNYRVRAIVRSEEKAKKLFGEKLPKGLQICAGDCRDESFVRTAVCGVDAIVCALGTTAFPSLRWRGGGPEATDYAATCALIDNAPESVTRFVLTSSIGVERPDQIPFSILNAFGVLKWKKQAEDKLIASGLPYTIIRPGRLTDGPYTSYDLNTLLQATSGARQAVQISARDDQSDEASRIAVAEAIVQLLKIETAINKVYSITSKEGEGPGQDPRKWQQLLESVR